MSGPFPGIDTSATALEANSVWLDQIAHNIANMNTVVPGDQEPFRASKPVFAAIGEQQGVEIVGLAKAEGDPALTFAPDHPLADADGNVATAVVDLAGEMTDMIVANRSYQANVQAIRDAKERYEAALRIGG
jgi:flagellar basal-body rod protein FlgC